MFFDQVTNLIIVKVDYDKKPSVSTKSETVGVWTHMEAIQGQRVEVALGRTS